MLSGIVKLRRGIGEHLAALSDAEVRVFFTLLLNAEPTGKDRGVWHGTQRDLAQLSGASRSSTNRALLQLVERSWIARIPGIGYQVLKYEPDRESSDEESLACPSSGTNGGSGKGERLSLQRDKTSRDLVPPEGQNGDEKANACPSSGTNSGESCPSSGTSKILTPLLSIEEEKKIRTPPLPPPAGGELVGGEHSKAFDLWYGVYPRKVAKQDARKAFLGVIRTADDWRLLLANSKAWIEHDFAERSTDKIPYPATFLRRGDWQEPPPEKRSGSTRLRSAVDELRDL